MSECTLPTLHAHTYGGAEFRWTASLAIYVAYVLVPICRFFLSFFFLSFFFFFGRSLEASTAASSSSSLLIAVDPSWAMCVCVYVTPYHVPDCPILSRRVRTWRGSRGGKGRVREMKHLPGALGSCLVLSCLDLSAERWMGVLLHNKK